MGLKMLFVILAASKLICAEWVNNCDISLNVAPLNITDFSNLTIENQIYKHNLNRSLICSQKLRLFINKTFEISLGSGLRKSLYDKTVGFHILLDLSKNLYTFFPQFGTTLEILGKGIEYRVNSYFPFPSKKLETDYFWRSKNFSDTDFLWRSHKWSEVETLIKLNHFTLSFAPGYNFTQNIPVGKVKILIPTAHCYVSGGIQYDIQRGLVPFMYISIPFYSSSKGSLKIPVSRSSGVSSEGVQAKYGKFPKIFTPKSTHKVSKKNPHEEREIHGKNIQKKEIKINPEANKSKTIDQSWWQSIFGVFGQW